MKSILTFAVLALVLLSSAVLAQEPTIEYQPLDWEKAALEDGADLYRELCAVCHGDKGLGDGPAVPALKVPPPDLTTLAAENDGVFPERRLFNVIRGAQTFSSHGTRDMPIWGHAFEDVRPEWRASRRAVFAQRKIQSLVEYVETLQAPTE